jgi:hypothetical protein
LAVVSPMPEEAPVIRATPISLLFMLNLLVGGGLSIA